MICNNNNNNNKKIIESRVRHRMTSSDTSDEHSSDELLMTAAATRLGRPNGDGKASSSSSESCHSSSHLPGNSMNQDDPHAVGQWLQFLQMDMYLQGFIDNGYDDFETIKQIGAPDLEAIGVTDGHHRAFLLDAVRVLREQGAVWVYLLHEDPDSTADQFPDRASAGGSSGIASGNSSSIPWTLSSSEPEHEYGATTSSSGAENSPRNRGSSSKLHRCKAELTPGHYPWPASATASNPSARFQTSQVYSQEDEDLIEKVTDLNFSQFGVEADLHTRPTKTERQSNKVNKRLNQEVASKLHPDQRPQLTSMQLAILVREKLHKECINLANAPFNSKVGDDYLTGLATRYASELGTDEIDVLHQLDDFRQLLISAADNCNKKQQMPNSCSVNNPLMTVSPNTAHTYANLHEDFPSNGRTYSPGIYASSSCLSDKEEDIYDLAAKYEGSAISGDRNRFFGSPAAIQKLKVSPPGWYTKARKAMSKNNSMSSIKNDDFMTSEFPNRDFHLGSPTLMRTFLPSTPNHNNGGEQRFSTRTRLRPGGPGRDTHHNRAHNSSLIMQQQPQHPRRPGSALSHFEEMSMRTMSTANKGQFLHHRNDVESFDVFPQSTFSHSTMYKPTTPIVKQRTFNSVTSSPRVQMYRTRVVYNDVRPSSAGLMAHEAAV